MAWVILPNAILVWILKYFVKGNFFSRQNKQIDFEIMRIHISNIFFKACRQLIVLAFFLLVLSVNGQIFINEFSASNATQIEDTDFEKYSDWIELYNAGATAQNLNGYFVSDDFKNPEKWRISSDLTIEAGGFLLLWADGNDTENHANFKLSADGEELALYNPNAALLDSISFGVQTVDVSMGRTVDANANWSFFETATPKASNSTTSYESLVYHVPEFSIQGGFYTSTQTVELATDLGGEIRYTTDGSKPLLTSEKYTTPIRITSTTIVRSRIFIPNLLPGPIVTHSYFINENSVETKLPVVSIATEPSNFWDPNTGIYVQDYKPLWEVPINIELFENKGGNRAAFNERAGCKVNGLWSWQLPQKMLGVYFKKQHGSKKLEYPLMTQRKRSSYKSFSLRASGSDWSYTLFRDMLGHQSTMLNMDLDIMAFKPSLVYVNGQYMGIHNIREKVNDDYIEKSYQLDSGSFDLVENEDFAESGDLQAYNDLLLLLSKELSNEANFDAVANVMDIENFTDYVIAEMAVANTSINHNVMAWKPKQTGKWRWILMDVDRGFFKPNDHLIDFYSEQTVWPFSKLLSNAGYKAYFGKRLADQLYTSYDPVRMMMLIDKQKQAIQSELPKHVERWEGRTSSYGDALSSVDDWSNAINTMSTFVAQRPAALLKDLENYGFDGTSALSLRVFPKNAGTLTLNGLTVSNTENNGLYLNNIPVQLMAENRPGYEFVGWSQAETTTLIQKGASWKYFDGGDALGASWNSPTYDDASWSVGMAQLGYGDGDEATEIGYGSDSSDKHMTSYFRKTISITAAQKSNSQITLNLLCDDGGIVYLNGVEVFRTNMPSGSINYETPALSSVFGSAEDTFTPFAISTDHFVVGENTLAVEVHQRSTTSSDLSFDLELLSYQTDTTRTVSNTKIHEITISENTALTAVFKATDQCIIPELISTDTMLSKDCSPYLVQGDVTVESNATLTVEAGVEIWMPLAGNIIVKGSLNAIGTDDNRIVFKRNPATETGSWGALLFQNTAQPSSLKYTSLEAASQGPDPVFDIAAISAFDADLVLDHLTIENVKSNPITARYSDITLTNSKLHSEVTGDCINVKYGKARIENCQFLGNDQPDTDAIDYDGIEGGVIKNCFMSNFRGFNSDAIDIGEKSKDLVIDSIVVCNITDKGVSLGQRSTASIKNAVFINCNKGVAVKDSSNVLINRSVFYNNVDAVACYEKNLGSAGGNATVTNSILSNSSNKFFFVDAKSTLESAYCLTDFTTDTSYPLNLQGNPRFTNPTFFDFYLQPNSLALNAGMENGTAIDIGTVFPQPSFEPNVMISQIFTNLENSNIPEFLTLYNPSNKTTDLSGYAFTKGISAVIPEGVFLEGKELLILTKDASATIWEGQNKQVLEWQSGKLSNTGESLHLQDRYGIAIDHLKYQEDGRWPVNAFRGQYVLQIKDDALDNHFAESWTAVKIDEAFVLGIFPVDVISEIYPNPSSGFFTIKSLKKNDLHIKVFSLSGQLLLESQSEMQDIHTLDLSLFPRGVYYVKIAAEVHKLIKL